MLIVLEGCDGTGKTTLANNIAKVIGGSVIHCTRETPNNYDFFEDIILAAEECNIVADRFMYGQFVYQTAGERIAKGWLRDADKAKLEVLMLKQGVKVFHVTAPLKDIEQRLTERGETTHETVGRIVMNFATLFADSLLPIGVIDTTKLTW